MGIVVRIITGILAGICFVSMLWHGLNGPKHRFYDSNRLTIELNRVEILDKEIILSYHKDVLTVFEEYQYLSRSDSKSSKINVEECTENTLNQLSEIQTEIANLESITESTIAKNKKYLSVFEDDKVYFSWSWKIAIPFVVLFLFV